MIKRRTSGFVLLTVIVSVAAAIGLLALTGTAHSQTEEQTSYTGVDIVFLVDQSGSMGGAEFGSDLHPTPNDPNRLRFLGLQELIERLSGYRLNYFHDSEVRFQVAVLNFGSTVDTTVGATVIDPDTLEEWEPLGMELSRTVSIENFGLRNLGNTHHLGALQAAKAQLDQMRQNWEGGEHVQAIMLLTDGEWYVDCTSAPADTSYCQDGFFQAFLYAEQLDDYIEANLPSPPYRLFVGAINDVSGEYWSDVRAYWERWTDGNAELVDANTMWAFFEGILADLTVNEPGLSEKKTTRGTVEVISDTIDRVLIPPYLQEIEFVIHKPTPSVRVTLLQDGQPVEDMVTTVVRGRERFIERITLHNPQPGYITIQRPVNTGILRIFLVKIVADVTCDPLVSVSQFVPVRLQCTLSGSGGTLSPYNDPRFRLNVQSEISKDGATQPVVLSPESASTYTGYYLPAETGEHQFSIVATTQNPDGTPFELFRNPPTGMSTFTVEPTTPRLEAEGTLMTLVPASLRVTLVGASGQPLPVPPDAAQFVTMRLMVGSSPGEATVELQPEAEGYAGQVTLAAAGTHEVRLVGEVEDPASGQVLKAFDQVVGSLEALPPDVAWAGFSSPWPQYRPAEVSFSLTDQSGQPFAPRMAAGWSLSGQALIADASGSSHPVTLTMTTLGHWQGVYMPQEAGDFALNVVVTATQAGAESVRLIDQELTAFRIRPMTLVHTVVRAPTTPEWTWRDLLWRPRPLEMRFALTDSAGEQLLVPEAVLEDPTQVPIAIAVVGPDGQVVDTPPLEPSGTPGEYRTELRDYGAVPWYAHRDLGWYSIVVTPTGTLQETFIYQDDGAPAAPARVHLVRHPRWWLLPAALAVLFVIVLARALLEVYRHLWAAEGTLRLEGAGAAWIRRLRDYGNKHTHVFARRSGLPSSIRKIVAHQPQGQNHLQVTVHFRSGAKNTYMMPSGVTKGLGGNLFLSYERSTAKANTKPGLSLGVLAHGLLGVLMLAGLGSVLFSVLSSLS